MHYYIEWKDEAETTLTINIRGGIGIFDYMPPLNDAGGMALMVGTPINLIFDLGWGIPYPKRGFNSLFTQIMGAPHTIQTIHVIVRNPLAYIAMEWLLLRPYPDVRRKLILLRQ